MSNIAFLPAKQLAALIRRKKIGCLELLDLYLKRIERYNPAINAIILMNIEAARKRAKQADRVLRRGELWGPLHGVPMTIKESYDVAGMPTTWGVPQYKDNYPQRNAMAVDRFLKAGVILFGKTNVPLYLSDWHWGFGRYAPEASVGMGSDSEKAPNLRRRMREALAPAPSTKKSPPYDSKRTDRTPRPGHLLALTPDLNPLRLATRD